MTAENSTGDARELRMHLYVVWHVSSGKPTLPLLADELLPDPFMMPRETVN